MHVLHKKSHGMATTRKGTAAKEEVVKVKHQKKKPLFQNASIAPQRSNGSLIITKAYAHGHANADDVRVSPPLQRFQVGVVVSFYVT